jgi:hypothetical protein
LNKNLPDLPQQSQHFTLMVAGHSLKNLEGGGTQQGVLGQLQEDTSG